MAEKDIDSEVTYYLSGASWELVIRKAQKRLKYPITSKPNG